MENNILRAFGEIRATDAENRTYEFIISDESLDRHGSVILSGAWDLNNFNKNGIFCYQHLSGGAFEDNNPDTILGPAAARLEGKQLIGTCTFEPAEDNQLAEKIKRKVDFGTLKATSVGFVPIDYSWGDEKRGEDPGVFYFRKVDLLEFSIVNIPSNPNAVRKSFDQSVQKLMEESKVTVKKRGMSYHEASLHFIKSKNSSNVN